MKLHHALCAAVAAWSVAACTDPATTQPTSTNPTQGDISDGNETAADTIPSEVQAEIESEVGTETTVCTPGCTEVGATQCDNNGVQTCADPDGDGCYDWSAAVDCGALTCSAGHCAVTCTAECTVAGARQCDGNDVETCADLNQDGCLEWATPTACGSGTTCSNGNCAIDCTAECTVVGARQCAPGDGTQSCADHDQDGCLDWGDVTPCPADETCSNGTCASTCNDECSVAGARGCGGPASVKTCGDTNADGCLEWGTAVACNGDEICSNGHCATNCSDECTTLGGFQCSGSEATQECGDYNQDGCLEWGTPVACGVGSGCSGGRCATTCTDECTVLDRTQCAGGAAAAIQTCGNFDGDACFEWGTAIPCDPGEKCSNGTCAVDCSDACPAAGNVQCNLAKTGLQTCGDYNQDGCIEWGTATPCGGTMICVSGKCEAQAPPGTVVLSELLYNDAGADDSAFVELYGEPGMDLAGFKLVGVNGANGQDYNAITLSGALDSAGYFLVVLTGSATTLLDVADLVDAKADFQNGPDNVQLRWGTTVVDAVGYGTFGTKTFAGEGAAAADPGEGKSLGRDADATDTNHNDVDFAGFAAWTPAAANVVVDPNTAPTAKLTCPSGAKTGVQLSFEAAGSSDPDGTIQTYAFSFGDGGSQTTSASSASHAYATPGTKTVTLTVTDDDGATDSDTCSVTISDANAPTVVFVKPIEDLVVTQGATVAVTADATATAGRSIAQVELLADGAIVGAADTIVPFTFSFTVPAAQATGSTVQLVLRATDDQGSVGVSIARVLSVENNKPVASFSAIVTGTLKATVDASGSSDTETAAAALLVRWDWENDGTWDTDFGTTKTATHTYAADGAYVIAMEVKDAVGQVTKATRTINFASVLDVSGEVTSTVWYGTVNITGDTHVAAGQTLTIASGTTVVFVEVDQNHDGFGDYDLIIDGKLDVQGTAADPVIFTVLPTGGGAKDAKSWNSIILNSGAGASTIAHAVIEYATVGLTLKAPATVSDTELRSNGTGLVMTSITGKPTLTNVNVHDSTGDGISGTSSAFTATNLTSSKNGWRGVFLTGGTGSTVTGCTVSQNALHGWELNGASVDIDECDIESNGKVGVYYREAAAGKLKHSQVKYNGQEGVRALGASATGPTPTIEWNNIFGNAANGSLVVASVGLTVATTAGYYGTSASNSWSPPSGATIEAFLASYSEYDSNYVEGSVLANSGATLANFAANTAATWFVPATTATSLKAQVVDGHSSSYYGTISVTSAAHISASARNQLTVVTNGGTLLARHNYFGTWPDVVSVVAYSAPGRLDLSGFARTAFDASWSLGDVHGAETVTTATTWDSDVFVSGDVTIGAGGTLTIAPGVTVTFVPTDKDADAIGDWRIDRAAGALSAVGTAERRITFTSLGAVPVGGAYGGIVGSGTGTSTITYAKIQSARDAISQTAGATVLTQVDTVDNARNGLRVTAGTISWDHGTVSGNGQEGIYASTPAATLYDHLTVDNNAAFGLRIQGTTTKGTLRNSTITHNTLGGVWLVNAALDVTSNHLKYNGYGLYIEGTSSGAVTLNDVLYNERDGVFACFNSSGGPTSTVKSNNLYGNATVDGSYLETVSVSVSTTAAYYGTSSSATTYSTGGPLVAFVKATYSEYDSNYVEGGLYASNGSQLVSWSAAATGWYDLRAVATTSIMAKVVDGHSSSYYGAASASRVLYVTQATAPARFVEMAAVLQSGSIDATANYWGTFPDVPSRVVEAENGTINYTGFKSVPVAGTGPQ